MKKLDKIKEHKVLYNIVFRNIGVALQFYDATKVKPNKSYYPAAEYWKAGLTIDKYYPTLEEAIDAEYKIIIGGGT